MSCVKFTNTSATYHCHAFTLIQLFHYSLHSFVTSRRHCQNIIIVIKNNERTLQHPYQTRAKARIMSEIEEVQEQMKADMEAMKDQMTTMTEAMMSMRKMSGYSLYHKCRH